MLMLFEIKHSNYPTFLIFMVVKNQNKREVYDIFHTRCILEVGLFGTFLYSCQNSVPVEVWQKNLKIIGPMMGNK